MLHALHTPACNDLRTVGCHLASQCPDDFGINTTQSRRPFGIFGLAVRLAQQVRQELIEANAIGFEEVGIMQIVNLFEDEENFDRLRACRTEQEVLDLIDRTNAAA